MHLTFSCINLTVKERHMEQAKYLTDREVSEITGIAISTLRNNRFLGKGIAYSKIGRAVRYSIRDVIDFMESRKICLESPLGNGRWA